MYVIAHGTTRNLSDAAAFIEILNRPHQNPSLEAHRLFDGESELFITRAPGRLDVMGGIADYSGSLVLEMPIHEATLVALQRDSERRLKIVSLSEDLTKELVFEMSLDDFESDGVGPIDYSTARAYFERDRSRHWAAYVAGLFLVLMRERGVRFDQGARILIASRVPGGKGVSSSAALEVAVMQAVKAAFGLQLEAREIALLCQMAENLVVGAPCGVMDQMTSACGETDRLLKLLCQPAEPQGVVSIPGEISFWGLDSGVSHSVTGADYGSVRVGAFMGYRIIAELAGLKVREGAPGERLHVEDARWGGYLANITPSEFEQQYAARLPERIKGAEFLARYRGTTDHVTRVDALRSYAVRVPAAHAVYEHHRVRLFAQLLEEALSDERLALLGELMYQSHASYRACGLSVAGTDRLVELVREAGPAQGLYGAKITGGGSGGTVAVLGRRDARPAVSGIAQRYARETGQRSHIFAGSSPGSAEFGYLKLSADRN
ncbi:MAG TPA: galactokinase family protein [Pyrinomonadaceae bacterium]|jgi:L-arabinokinase